ncbi:MAG: UvrD-helicase domain-containing protein, partial [Thermoanaerobaculia bacterium]
GVLAAFGEADRARLRSVQRGSAAPAMADALDRSTAAGESFAAGSIDQLERLLRELREIWTESLLGRLGSWTRDVYTQAERQALEHRTETLSAAAGKLQGYLRHISRLDPRLLDLARRALGPIMLEVERRLRARGVATFQALLVEARDLLARRPPVRRRERRRIRQLLVDEFQDTDRLQCDLIRMLALQGQPSERPGLFVVGDPKQSIFGWRNADLEAYEEFVRRALESGGIRHSLTRNFRSAPPILQEVERAVEPVMIQEAGLQPRFEPLVADRAGAPGFAQERWAPVEYWVSWLPPDAGDAAGPRPGANEIALLEARAIAADIVALHDGQDVKWQQIGLLLRSMNQLETYLGALREADVPFAVARDKQYYRRREIIEAAALVRTVLNPLDHLALLTTLRSASVGVPDAALIPLWQEGFPGEITELAGPDDARLDRIRRIIESVVRRLPAGIPGLDRIRGWELNLQRAVLNLALLRESYRRQPSDRFLERLRQRWLLETTEAARYLGPYRVANLARFFRRLEVALEESGGDMQAILRALRRSVSEAQEAEEARPLEAAENAVQVLTIHRAKGLEFRHVYLVQLHARTRESATPWVDADERWAPDGPREYALFGSPTPDFDRVEERRRRVAVGERVRTLYVAMTRARDRLVLVGNWPETPRPVSLERATSHLDLLQRRRPLPDSFSELRDRCADQVSRRLDQHHARWRFLQHSTPGGPPQSARAGAPATLPAPSEIEQAAQTLRNLRVEARQRMARPYVEAASARLGELRPKEPGRHAVAVGRDVALAVGRAVHRMLETWRFDAEPTGELARQRRLLHEGLERRLSGDLVAEALRRTEVLLARLEAGSMLDRLAALGPKVLGREVPVLLPGGEGDAGAVGCTVGVVDLLYRDSPAGRTVIVDYKTDDVTEPGEIEARAEAYHPQIAVYRQAVQQALGLADPPEAELWFLLADRVWRSS